jgi:hypothetical protein
MLKYLFWQGLRLQDNFNEIQSAITQFIPEPNAELESQLLGKPTPLLAVLGLPYDTVKKQVDKVKTSNSYFFLTFLRSINFSNQVRSLDPTLRFPSSTVLEP